jgi:alkaline phosphatase
MAAPLAITFAVTAAIAVPCAASPPVVQGPESVADWNAAGQAFIASGQRLQPNTRRAKNIILFVGDGMGISTQTAARILDGQLNGRPGEENRLSFETLPYAALSKTYSWDQQTADSAPTMTAMSTGFKAREGMLSVDHLTPRGECNATVNRAHALKTILEYSADIGKSTGIVTTARLTHATPAALYAHIAFRDWEADSNQPVIAEGVPCRGAPDAVKDIARQFVEVQPSVRKSLKVALGGGRTYFLPSSRDGSDAFDPEYPTVKGRRADGRDLTAEWLTTRGAGAAYVWNKAQFDAIDIARTPYLLGLFEPSHVQYEADKAKDGAGEPTLSEMTAKALQMLQKERKGYFLHVEGGRIDHAHHAGNARRALVETIEFAKAVRYAMDHTDAKDTLIIVTADHSHTFTIAGYPSRGNDILGLVREVPATDGAPLAPSKDANGLPFTTLGYFNGPGYRKGGRPDLTSVDTTDLEFLQEAAVPLGSETHAGEDVAIFARGPQAHLVRGSMEQNWIFHVMRTAFGF